MWPKRINYYLHGGKEENWQIGKELSLSEDTILNQFRFTGYEVSFELEVNEDGTNTVLQINGIDVSEKGINI